MRSSVIAVAISIACAGCSLFLLDGLNTDEPAANEAGAPDASGGGDDGPGPTSNDGSTDGSAESSTPVDDVYGAAVKLDAPIGWWRLDDAAGSTTAKEATGKSADATIAGVGGLVFAQPGATSRGTAFVFDGTAQLELGDAFDFPSPQPYSFEAWVKPALPQNDTDFHSIISKITYTQVHTVNGRWLYYNQSTPRIALEEWNTDTSYLVAGANKAFAAGKFTYVVVTFDGKIARSYLDGELQESFTTLGTFEGNDVIFKWGEGWKGALDELAVYDKALDPARIAAHFAAGKPD